MQNTPIRIPRPKHTLSRHNISQAALDVLYHLHQANYQAFLVGGGVRDVLLERVPKDFDIVTNAHPEQVKYLFNHCRLIGRRFVLVHVYVKTEIIEVTTFRAPHDKGGDGAIENGQIIRDNVYGNTVDEDAQRRDFTINAIYYDISDFSLFDYANGMADLRDGVIRLIGDPMLRYQEDPVRMLRATRFAAKLGFSISPETAAPIRQLGGLLANIPPARLFEEVLKLFLSGHAKQSFDQLRHYDLFRQLFPYTDACLEDPIVLALITQVLHNTDERKLNNQSVMPAFLFAALLWPPLSLELPKTFVKGMNQQEILFEACQMILTKQHRHVAIPKRISVLMQEIWWLQIRLTRLRRGKKKSLSVLNHPKFRAGYDLLQLRANAGEEDLAIDVEWWTNFLKQDENGREVLFPSSPKKNLRRRKNKREK
ncbi:MAG: polynucleotide adenylyltransferase PcnB [Thiotrichaceae bacterium]|nr:polynucleotide adenylyltransferase PcnB [Thiotrichaceae bacterium]